MAAEPYSEPARPDDSGDLERVLTILRRRAGLIILCTLLTAGAAVIFSLLQEKQYTATASLLFRDPGFAQNLFGGEGVSLTGSDATRQAATNVQLVGLEVISERTATALDTDLEGADVREAVSVSAEGQSDVVSIEATSPEPELAQQMANTFAREFIEFRAAADRTKLLKAKHLAEEQYSRLSLEERNGPRGAQLSRGAERLGILASLQTGNAELVQPAQLPASPSSPRPRRNGILGFTIGLLLGTALAFLLEGLNRKIRTPDEASATFGLPVLGTIPESKAIADSNDGFQNSTLPLSETEAFRMLRASLQFFNVDKGLKTLVVTSAAPQEGKSTVAWNLALASASLGSVLLLETDLRNPSISRQHGIKSGPGLAELLTHQVTLDEVTQSYHFLTASGEKADTHLNVITGGAVPPNPAELLESATMSRILDQLEKSYDQIVIDTAPVGLIADALALTRQADGVLLVTRTNQSSKDEAHSLTAHLRRLNANLIGLAVNAVRQPRGKTYGYGTYNRGTSGDHSRP